MLINPQKLIEELLETPILSDRQPSEQADALLSAAAQVFVDHVAYAGSQKDLEHYISSQQGRLTFWLREAFDRKQLTVQPQPKDIFDA